MHPRPLVLFTFLFLAATPLVHAIDTRQVLAADSNWKFFLGDPASAEAPSFDDSSWRRVDLPHDWSIENPPAKDNPSGAGEGFFPAGTGWYRNTFRAPRNGTESA